jgi:hypothetical protein
MSKDDEKPGLIYVKINPENLGELADFIENELKPPSKVKWLLLWFALGILGGWGLGLFIASR